MTNQPDPLWKESASSLRRPVYLLQDVPNALQKLYCRIHELPYVAGDDTALRLVSQPNLSNIEWIPFQQLVQTMIDSTERRQMVIAGVTGTGATKQAKRAANLIAGSTERVMQIDCSPETGVEMHREFIGAKDDKGQFQPGTLVRFWEDCLRDTKHKYALVFDNFDKINPETFFGAELWEALSSKSRSPEAEVKGYKITLPSNCYMFSVTHLGPGSYYQFNEEHFKRLGPQFIIKPNIRELCGWLREQRKIEKDSSKMAALQDTAQLQRYLYTFLKINALIKKRYGEGYQLGQGSNIRPLFRDSDRPLLKKTFLNHISGLQNDSPLEAQDLESVEYAIRTRGIAYSSSFFARQVQFLQDTGYFVEITMVAATALLTALVGWWVFRRREQLIRRYGERTRKIIQAFEDQELSAEEASVQLADIKHEVDQMVLDRRLGYTEGLYFLSFIDDKVRVIDYARNVSENFLELFNAFMEDEVLTENEYMKLCQFLDSIRHKIPENTFDEFRAKVEQAYRK